MDDHFKQICQAIKGVCRDSVWPVSRPFITTVVQVPLAQAHKGVCHDVVSVKALYG